MLAGADHETCACASPGVAMTPVGAPGTVTGTTADEGLDGALVPTELRAVTVKV